MLNSPDLSRTDLNLLVVFEAVMAERHVGRAAARLSLTPSAVSHALVRLRTLLGDPLFLRTPKGVTPTARANALAAPIADVLARARNVIASVAPFDPKRAARRFTIGAPDGVSAVLLEPLLRTLKQSAPLIDISVRQVLPRDGEAATELAWNESFAAIDAGGMDACVIPVTAAPARFHVSALYAEDFVIAMRARHPFARTPTLKAFCAAEHLVVSHTGDPNGFVDTTLAQRKLARRVALTVPNFMFALSVLAESDLIAALPRRFVSQYGKRYGLITREAPLKLPGFTISLIASHAAMQDAGVAWLAAQLERAAPR